MVMERKGLHPAFGLRLYVSPAGWADVKWEFPKIRGTLFRGPSNKDPSI